MVSFFIIQRNIMQNIGELLAGHNPVILFFILMVFYALGDFLATKTKALIPSILVFALLLLIFAWAGLIPPKIVEMAGITQILFSLMLLIMVVNMGTSLNIKDIINNWRTALIGIAALVGVAVAILAIGRYVFGWQTAVISAPAVGGGLVAAMEMKSAAEAINNPTLATTVLLIFTLQSFPAFIIIPSILKKYMRRELDNVDLEVWKKTAKEDKETVVEKTIIPDRFLTPATIYMMLALVGVLSYLSFLVTQTFMGQYAISTMIFALIYAIIFTEMKILPRNALTKAGANGLVLTIVIVGAFASLATTNRAEVFSLIGPIVTAIGLGVVGILIFSVIAGKIFKYPWEIAFSIGLNCLLGFPINYQLTLESINGLTDDADERAYLNEKVVPIMLVAGFTTVTIGSVFLAGILKNFL